MIQFVSNRFASKVQDVQVYLYTYFYIILIQQNQNKIMMEKDFAIIVQQNQVYHSYMYSTVVESFYTV